MELTKVEAFRRLKLRGDIPFGEKRFYQVCKELAPNASAVDDALFSKLAGRGAIARKASGVHLSRKSREKLAVLKRIREFDAPTLTGSEIIEICLLYGAATAKTLRRYGLKCRNNGEIVRYSKAAARDLVLGLYNKQVNL